MAFHLPPPTTAKKRARSVDADMPRAAGAKQAKSTGTSPFANAAAAVVDYDPYATPPESTAPSPSKDSDDKMWLLEERLNIARRKLAEFSLERYRFYLQVSADYLRNPKERRKTAPELDHPDFKYLFSEKWLARWRLFVAAGERAVVVLAREERGATDLYYKKSS